MLLFAALCSQCGCSGGDVPVDMDGHELDSGEWVRKFNSYSRRGLYDSLEFHSARLFGLRDRWPDNELVLFAGLNAAQAAIFQDDFVVAKAYLDSVGALGTIRHYPALQAMMSGISAVYEMKVEFDYPAALGHLNDALQYYRKTGNVVNECTALCNICMIYFLRRDTSGTEQARRAYELALSNPEEPYLMCASQVTLAMMLLMKGEYDRAESLAMYAHKLAKDNDFSLVFSRIYMVLGETAYKRGDTTDAEQLLKRGFQYSQRSDPDFYFELAIPYGRLLMESGRCLEAEAFLEEALAYSSDNVKYRHQILKMLSQVNDIEGDTEAALAYFKVYDAAKDSLLNLDKEIAFNNLLRLYEKASYESRLRRKEADLYIIVSVSVLSMLVGLFFFLRYRTQRRSYRELVERHRQFVQRSDLIRRFHSPESTPPAPHDADADLFRSLESLMRESKLYRQNDISLDKVASLLGSNRTYVSRIINRYAEKTFYGYVNMYRIEEATQILADVNSDRTMKSICDGVGYNSLTAFYRVFQKEIGCPPSKYREEVRRLKAEEQREDDGENARAGAQ